MSQHQGVSAEKTLHAAPKYTLPEILQQPLLWPVTLETVRAASRQMQLSEKLRGAHVLLTGAGTSAYAATAVAAAWTLARAVPTTDLLVDAERYLSGIDAVISLARSGNSPESAAVVEHVRALQPDIQQFAIVCDEEGALSRSSLDGLIVLDPRTNDQSLVMTSAFSNLVVAGIVLAGLAMGQPETVATVVHQLSARTSDLLPEIDEACQRTAARVRDRILVLSSSPLLGWQREAGLKTLEMTAGRFPLVSETYLGLRHGPMSFVTPDTLVLCLLSSNPVRRSYELDLIRELRAKRIGFLVGIADAEESLGLFDQLIPSVAPHTDDALRTPFEILGPQLLGYHLSLMIGLNPDNPSPDGVINRVVSGVKIYPPSAFETQGAI
jgi:tagatose-6-phosphate ketose/aldose isomerase